MAAHKLTLSSLGVRGIAVRWVEAAPEGTIVSFQTEPTRTDDQNAKMWPMLTDLSKQCLINGQQKPPETWKLAVMRALKHEVLYEMDLDGEPFPVGFSTKNLSKSQFSDLIEWMYKYGADNEVKWSERGYT